MRFAHESIRLSLMISLAVFVAMGTACKRQPLGPPAVATRPRVVGPSATSIHDEEIKKLRAQLQPLPELGEGVNFTDPVGEIWIKYPCGLMIHDLTREDNEVPQIGQTVTISYIGTFPGSNKEFDRSGPDNPLVFPLGSKDYVKGLSMGISTMHIGYKRRIFIPPDLAYGENGNPMGGIGPNQALIFEVALLKITGEPVPLADLPDLKPAGPRMPTTETAPATRP